MGEPNAPRDRSHRPAIVFLIPEQRLLPPVCPECGAAGSVPVAVPTDHPVRTNGGALANDTQPRLFVHRCDLCASHAARQATLRFAWLMSAVVVSVSLATAMTFIGGERGRPLQWVLLVLISGGLGKLAHARSRALDLQLKLVSERLSASEPRQQLLISQSSWLNQALLRSGFEQLDNFPRASLQQTLTVGAWSRLWPATPALAACVWWLGLNGLARSSVYVVNTGPGPAILLIDDRRQDTIAATRFEQPNLGYRHELLAGPRTVSLMTSSGQVLYSSKHRLLPGQTLLIARLMPETCVWQERLDYEHPGSASAWSLLARSTQAILLTELVDAWFTPLRDQTAPETPPTPVAPVADAAPGTRTAVRLLPCPAP